MGCKPIDASESGDGLSVLATTVLNPKAFIYCLAMVPMNAKPHVLGGFWIVLLGITATTGSLWLLFGKRLRAGRWTADKVTGAALVGFALMLLRPLIAAAAI